MSTTVVRVSEDLYAEAKQTAALFNRSASGQLEHWARIGRAVELSSDISTAQIGRMLSAAVGGKVPEHPHMRVVRMEAAVELVGSRIAAICESLESAESADVRDMKLVAELEKKLEFLSQLQDRVLHADESFVRRVLSGELPDDVDGLFDH